VISASEFILGIALKSLEELPFGRGGNWGATKTAFDPEEEDHLLAYVLNKDLSPNEFCLEVGCSNKGLYKALQRAAARHKVRCRYYKEEPYLQQTGEETLT
jgi:hypothetical protein